MKPQQRICCWQIKWDTAYHILHRTPIDPDVSGGQLVNSDEHRTWMNQSHFKHSNSPYYSSCPGVPDDTEHVLFHCSLFSLL